MRNSKMVKGGWAGVKKDAWSEEEDLIHYQETRLVLSSRKPRVALKELYSGPKTHKPVQWGSMTDTRESICIKLKSLNYSCCQLLNREY